MGNYRLKNHAICKTLDIIHSKILNISGVEETPRMRLILSDLGRSENRNPLMTRSWFESQRTFIYLFIMLIENYLEHEVRRWQGWLTQLRPYAWESGNSLAVWS